jgi:hypothetical protein
MRWLVSCRRCVLRHPYTDRMAWLYQLVERRATLERDESPPPNHSAMTPTPTTPLPLPPTPPRNRPPTPESPTPQRGPALAPSPPPLVRSPQPSSPTPAARHPLHDAIPPTDLTRQIAAVTEDPVGLRAEEQRLSQIQNEKVRSAAQYCSADSFSPLPQPQQLDALPHSSTPLRLTFRHILLVEDECTRFVLRSPV